MRFRTKKNLLTSVFTCIVLSSPTVSLAVFWDVPDEGALFNVGYGIGTYEPLLPEVRYRMGFQELLLGEWGEKRYLFDLSISDIQAGDTFTVTSGEDFDFAVGLLTNGKVDSLQEDISGTGVRAGSDTDVWRKYIKPDDVIVDFSPYTIDSITLNIAEVIFNEFDPVPWGPVWRYQVRAYLTMSLYDTNGEPFYPTVDPNPIPEPATVFLLGFGLLCLVGLRRKFKRS